MSTPKTDLLTGTSGMILKYFENALHDIKTPFSIIYSLIQSLASRDDLSAEAQSQIDQMKQCCYKISMLLHDVNDVGKIARGCFLPKYMNYDIVVLAESIARSIAPLAERKQIEVIFDTNEEEKVIAIDKNIFERILLNLLSNAIKFSANHSEVLVDLYCAADQISIEIIDNGCGISEEKITSVFERYEYADTPENPTGSGVGLDIVRDLVCALKGTIYARRNSNRGGTTVHVDLPAFTVAEDTPGNLSGYDFPDENIFQMELSDNMEH